MTLTWPTYDLRMALPVWELCGPPRTPACPGTHTPPCSPGTATWSIPYLHNGTQLPIARRGTKETGFKNFIQTWQAQTFKTKLQTEKVTKRKLITSCWTRKCARIINFRNTCVTFSLTAIGRGRSWPLITESNHSLNARCGNWNVLIN